MGRGRMQRKEELRQQEGGSGDLQFLTNITSRLAGFLNQMGQYLAQANLSTQEEVNPSQEVSKHQGTALYKKIISKKMKTYMANHDADYLTKKEDQKSERRVKSRRLCVQIDEQRPKGPTSSFLIYYHDKKKELAHKFKEVNVSKLTKLAGNEWKRLPEEQRQKYQMMSEQTKLRYNRQMQLYKKKYQNQIQKATKERRLEYRLNWMRKKKEQQIKYKDQTQSQSDSHDKNSCSQMSGLV